MKLFSRLSLVFIAAIILGCLGTSLAAAETNLPVWALGPFIRPDEAMPLIKPDTNSVFDCPMRKKPVHWEARHTFNPASVVRDGKLYLLYRAEDDSSKAGIGSFTTRLGLAVSEDGIHFVKEPAPVFYPADDSQKDWEWTGGCEDPRITEGLDGTYYLTYSQYTGLQPNGRKWRVGLASSKDLHHWTKYGSPFTGTKYENDHGGNLDGVITGGVQTKSAAIVNEVKDGRLVAAKINGKYWMYFGESTVNLANSDDLIHWVPVEGKDGKPLQVLRTRRGFFDSNLNEIGPSPLLTSNGIVVFYNGKNSDPHYGGDPELSKGVYTGGQALFAADDPTKLITRLDHPFIKPELYWEKSGQYAQGTTFTEGLSLFHEKWFLYYGCADTFVGVAVCPATISTK